MRQRTALALSEILVVSGTQIRLPYAVANYERILRTHAFGNFRSLLREVTLSPAMGKFLNMANNDKPNPARGIQPNENYACEVLQPQAGCRSPAHRQLSPGGGGGFFAHAFTGWTYPARPMWRG